MFTKKTRCTICGKRFIPTKENTYVVEVPRTIIDSFTVPAKYFDAMDCPQCGCQAVLRFREPRAYMEWETEQSIME